MQIVAHLVSGGAERGIVELARALVAAGWTSDVAHSGGRLERDIVRSHPSDPPTRLEKPATHAPQYYSVGAADPAFGFDIVHARTRGWLVPPGGSKALAEAIGEAPSLGVSKRAARYARRTTAHVAGRYTTRAMCARTLEVYEELLFPEAEDVGALSPTRVAASA